MSTTTPKRDHHETFESIKRSDDAAREYWLAHELAPVLGYQDYRNFQAVVETPLDYAVFQDHGYRGLYGGGTMRDIHAAKELKKSRNILDHVGSTELAANLFRATQTEEKLKRDGVNIKAWSNDTHLEVGRKVRATIGDLGGTMPEHLAAPDESIGQLERSKAKALKPKPIDCRSPDRDAGNSQRKSGVDKVSVRRWAVDRSCRSGVIQCRPQPVRMQIHAEAPSETLP